MELNEILSKIDFKTIKTTKEDLEQRIAVAHTSGENISQLASDLSYYSQIYDIASNIEKNAKDVKESQELLSTEEDKEMKDLAQEDITFKTKSIETLYDQLMKLEIDRELGDPDDSKSAILEIRAGAGGEEAALFAGELYRMYSIFAQKMGWQVEIIDSSVSESGGYKEILASIKGKNIYKYLKFESGVHRVQRVPSTESSGRIHTSTASVAILPEAKDIDIQIDPQDLRIDVMRATGAGGQNVNRTDSAVRITHLPTGIVVSCQETKHQDQNKEKAMNLLRSRLYEKKKNEEHEKRSKMRSSQIGTAMRAEKIRTYNFPQTRITDHRIKVSW
ncbi:MAG TPA: peptide chain release factor 1, partial [Candidatus Dojkabacteria bacterium]|nr:peptide chain release factor 1 [Candidatus Dojkabacteria bacterium]